MSWLDGLRHRVHVVLHRTQYAAERSEERRLHREMEEAEGRGGGEPEGEAHEAVRAPRGGGRGWRRLSTLGDRLAQDLRYALRGLARSPGFTAVALLTLALGVGANAAVFSLLDRLFNQPPSGVAEPETLRRLYIQMPRWVREDGRAGNFPAYSHGAFSAIRAVGGGAYDVAAWTPSREETLRDGTLAMPVRTTFVSHDYFNVLGVAAELGRLFGEAEARVDVPAPVAVIGHALWKGGFGLDLSVVGRTIRLASGDFTVVGVAGEGFAGLDLSYADVFLPLGAYSPSSSPIPWYESTTSYLLAVARAGAGVDDAQLSARATAGYLRRALPESAGQRIDSTEVILAGSIIERRGPGSRAGPADRDRAVSISTLTIGVSAMLLLIACANVAALLLVRASKRQREIAVRLALGISKRRLAFQLLLEALLLSAAAGGVAVVVAIPGGRTLRSLLLPDVRWTEHSLDVRTVAFALAVTAVVGAVAGLAPLLQSRRVEVNASLKSGARLGAASGSRLSSALVATQAALSIVLLVGASLFLRSLTNAAALRLGFDVDGLAFVTGLQSEPGSVDHAQAVAEVSGRLEAMPGVLGVATASSLPMAGLGIPGGVHAREPSASTVDRPPSGASYNLVSSEFFAVAGVRILEGRGFEDGESSRVAVVDEALARTYWPNRTALGGCLVIGRQDGPCWEVVGVAEDQRSRIIEEATLQLFLPLATGDPVRSAPPARTLLLRLDERHWNDIALAARDAVYSRFSERTVRISRMSDALEAQFRPWRVGAQLFTAFGVLALLVTAVGIYGVMAYAVSHRTHEMGVRMALGATLRDVATLVLRDGLSAVALGAALGIAAAFALGRMVESFLYGVTARDPTSALAAASLLMAAGAAASLAPALRAGRVDPCEALRQD